MKKQIVCVALTLLASIVLTGCGSDKPAPEETKQAQKSKKLDEGK